MISSLAALAEKRSFSAGICAAVFGSALLLLMAVRFLDHMPLYDELLHLLAARGLRDYGEPIIADGDYTRAKLFTWMVAVAIESFGDTLYAARLPSLIASVGMVTLTALWLTRRAGLLAGIAAAVFLSLVPATLDLAVFARFYTVHALLILAMSMAIYEAATPGRTAQVRIALVILATILLLPAIHFQITTLIALGAIVAGTGCVLLLDHWVTVWAFVRRSPIRIAVGLVAIAGIGLVTLQETGFLEALRETPVWASGAAGRPLFYAVRLAADMPLLWPLFPVAVIIAFVFQRRLTVFCTVLLFAALAVHSVAAAKSIRYIYYALPFYCIVWGCALAGAFAYARQLKPLSPSLGGQARVLTVVVVAAIILGLSQEGQRAVKLAVGRATTQETLEYAGEAEWSSAIPVLEPMIRSADRVVTSNAMKALYYFNRYNYELNVSIVVETDTGEEFGVDQRTGRQAIGSAPSMGHVLDLPGTTLIVLEEEKINKSLGVPPDVVAIIAARCSAVAVPVQSGIRAWTCMTAGNDRLGWGRALEYGIANFLASANAIQ